VTGMTAAQRATPTGVSVGTAVADALVLGAKPLGPGALALPPPAVDDAVADDAGGDEPGARDMTATRTTRTATTAKATRKPRDGAGLIGRSTTPS
jgi:hypothetical protein